MCGSLGHCTDSAPAQASPSESPFLFSQVLPTQTLSCSLNAACGGWPWHVQSPEVEDTALRPQPQGSPAITPGSCLPEAPATQTQHLRPLTSECALSPSLLMGRKVSVPQTGPQVVLCTMCQPTVREHQPRLEPRITGTVLASTVA